MPGFLLTLFRPLSLSLSLPSQDDPPPLPRHPPPPGPSAARALAAATAALAALAPPATPLERLLRSDAEAAAAGGPCARAVARALARAGWAARTRDALPAPPSVKGKAVFEHLRHAFVVVDVDAGAGASASPTLVVDVAFRDAFCVRGAPAAWASLTSRLPPVWVGPADRLAALVTTLGYALEACFADAGLALPPWRSGRALLSKWRPAAFADGPRLVGMTTPPAAVSPPSGASPLSPAVCALGCCTEALSPPASPQAARCAAVAPAALGAGSAVAGPAPPLAGRPPRPPPPSIPVPAAAAAAVEAAGRSLLSSHLARASLGSGAKPPAPQPPTPIRAGQGVLASQLVAPVRQVKMVGAI